MELLKTILLALGGLSIIGGWIWTIALRHNDIKHIRIDLRELKSMFLDHQRTIWRRIDELKEVDKKQDIALGIIKDRLKIEE